MATIQTRKTQAGRFAYRVQVRLKGHPPQTATFERKTDAKHWANQVEAAIRENRYFGPQEAKRRTFAEMIDRYILEVLPRKKPRTQTPQRQQLDWWCKHLGAYRVADITPPLLIKYRDQLSRRFSPATVNRYLAVLSHCFTIAVREWQWTESNPLHKVTRPREPRGRVRFLSEEERERLLAACRESSNHDLYTAVVLALSTGARKTELMTLSWSQVDLNRGAIILHETKNGERRMLPLMGHAAQLMKERCRVRRIDTDLVFPGAKGQPVDLRNPWEAALKKADITDFRWHDLRHSCASYLAMNGASLAEIAEILGHKTLAMVRRYTHLSDAHTARVVERMNRNVFGQ